MNDTALSAPGASLIPDSTDLFTTGAFIVIAILMALTIAGIIFGARLSSRRKAARRELEAHNVQVGRQEPSTVAAPPLAPEAREAAQTQPPVVTSVVAPVAAPSPPAARADPIVPAVLRERVAPEPTPVERPIVAAPPAPPPPPPAPPPPAPTGPPPADGPVTQLKGLGPKVAARLGELGIATVGQLAALSDDQAQSLDAHLGPFTGRMARDRWQEQARFLAAGDRAGFEAVFGRL